MDLMKSIERSSKYINYDCVFIWSNLFSLISCTFFDAFSSVFTTILHYQNQLVILSTEMTLYLMHKYENNSFQSNPFVPYL